MRSCTLACGQRASLQGRRANKVCCIPTSSPHTDARHITNAVPMSGCARIIRHDQEGLLRAPGVAGDPD